MVEVANKTSPFGLTGAIFVKDPDARAKLCDALRDVAGNFYINDKSTGSVVGQQPFGGARLSGESVLCLLPEDSMVYMVGLHRPVMQDRLVGLVVKASTSRVEEPGFEFRLRWDFFRGQVIPVT